MLIDYLLEQILSHLIQIAAWAMLGLAFFPRPGRANARFQGCALIMASFVVLAFYGNWRAASEGKKMGTEDWIYWEFLLVPIGLLIAVLIRRIGRARTDPNKPADSAGPETPNASVRDK